MFKNQRGAVHIIILVLIISLLGVFIIRDKILNILFPAPPSQTLTYSPNSYEEEDSDEEFDDHVIDPEEFPDE